MGGKWVAPATVFVALQLALVGMLALILNFYEWPPFGKYFATTSAVVGFVGVGLAVWRLKTLPPDPIAHLKTYDWSSFKYLAVLMGLAWLQFVALTWAKVMIPVVGPMWADVPLADLEAAILGGDAWRFLPPKSPIVTWAYAMWPIVLCISLVLAFYRQSERRDEALLAFFLTIGILGTFGQFALPSGGPIFFERLGYGDRFEAIDIPSGVRLASNYLWAAYQEQTTAYAAGISAFPSIHVATAAWIAIALRHWAAYLYLALIFAGSIMLGWHYALDGVAGIAGAILCYKLAKELIHAKLPRASRSDRAVQ